MELWAIEYNLVNATPEYVFEWLKNNVDEKRDEERDKLENALLSRNEKLINLGLALFGEAPSVGHKLFKSTDLIIKRATLAGRSIQSRLLEKSWVMNDDVIPVLLEKEKQNNKSENNDYNDDNDDNDDKRSLLHELLNNKFLPSGLLEAVYEKSGYFSDIDDDLWISLVTMTVGNERLSTPYKSTWMDGYAEYKYKAVFSAAWRLFKEFPVNIRSARVLSDLSGRLVPIRSSDMKATDVIDRWRSDNEEEESSYSDVRTALVKMIGNYSDEFKELKNHKDLAIRKGYYKNLQLAKAIDITEGFNKDGSEFLESALFNDSFYTSKEMRGALEKACWKAPDEYSRMDFPNLFRFQVEQLSANYPQWFEDSCSDELASEEIEDPEDRRDKQLEYLNTQVAELHEAVLGEKDEYQEINEFGENSVLNDLRLELQQIAGDVSKLSQEISFPWGWLAAGIAFGFIIGKDL